MIKPLARRALLRGSAAGLSCAIGLPLLEAMLDRHGEALADGSALPQRWITWFFGNGVILNRFVPAAQFPNPWAPSEELMPFQTAGVKDYVSVLTGFNNASAHFITHHEGMTVFSGHDIVDVGQGQGIFSNAGGKTLDQVIADLPHVGGQTPIPSMQVGVSKEASQVDFGTTTHNVSHRGYLQPLPPNHSPQSMWTTLFDSFVPPEDPQGPLRLSVLDLAKDQIAKLEGRLGAADRARLEAHLDGIRTLEQKIQALPPLCDTPVVPTQQNVGNGANEPIRPVCEVMSDLIVHAFTCDVTRVASFMLLEPAAKTIYGELGHTGEFHNYTHSASAQDPEVHDGVVFAMENLAYLLRRLMDTPEPSASTGAHLLDNTICFASSEVAVGYDHSIDDQPIIVAGRGGGALRHPGIHHRSNGDNPSKVLLGLLQVFDPTATEIGSGAPYTNQSFDLLKSST
ncbi:MAG: DUF1552 domain-containing protein [Myxococcota bacterium]